MKYDNLSAHVRKGGRSTEFNNTIWLGFSAAYLEFETEAAEITVTFRTDENPAFRVNPARAGVWVNGARQYNEEAQAYEAVLAADVLITAPLQTVKVSLGEAGVTKKVKLVRLSECSLSLLGIGAVETAGNFEIRKTMEKKPVLEIIGDSITCGYGNEGRDGIDEFSSATENALDAYAVRTAEKLQMDWRLVSWSGIGVYADYTPPEQNVPNRSILMQDLYPYNDARTEDKLRGTFKEGAPFYTDDKTPFDFSENPPKAVVILLGTNDLSFTRNIPERNGYFAYEYRHLLEEVRYFNPGCPILCTLGVQGTILNETLAETVKAYAARHPETDIRFLPLEEQPALGKGINGHPSKRTHEALAEKLSAALRKMLG